MANKTINFEALNDYLLSQSRYLLVEWLPGGKLYGKEYKCADLSGAKGDSLSVNIDKGVWKDFATGDGGADLISLYAAIKRYSQIDAAKELERQYNPQDNGYVSKPTTARKPSKRTPFFQPPEDHTPPDISKYPPPVHLYTYKNINGRVSYYRLRWDKFDPRRNC